MGVVLTPTAIERFSVSVDYWETRIDLRNHQPQLCERCCSGSFALSSAPNYDSPVCDLGGAPDHGPFRSQLLRNPLVNMPTEIRSAPVNAALQKTKGYDLADRLQLG